MSSSLQMPLEMMTQALEPNFIKSKLWIASFAFAWVQLSMLSACTHLRPQACVIPPLPPLSGAS